MKRILMSLFVAAGLAFPAALAAPAFTTLAVDPIPICNTNAAKNTDVCKEVKDGASAENPIIRVISIAINFVTFIIGVMSVVVIIVSGIRLITSQGDAQSVATARSALIYALIALAVVVLARVIVGFVLNAV